jgi:hypothetical protein
MAAETVQLTKNDLKEILADQARLNAELLRETIAEIKKPTQAEQRELDATKLRVEQEQKERQALSKSLVEEIENKKTIQRLCSHEHRNGDTHAVYIQEKSGPGYFICQKNQCKIRPGNAPEGYKGGDIYDTALFNRLFQKSANNDIFG